jgi:hypothetical protein
MKLLSWRGMLRLQGEVVYQTPGPATASTQYGQLFSA